MQLEKPETVTLRDGSAVTIRPIRPDDARRLQALFYRLSPESISLRFLGHPKELPDAQAEQLANVDYRTRMALVATREQDGEEHIIAVARYAADPAGQSDLAEAAIVVEDEYQKRGLGTLLLSRLVAYAQAHGIRAFMATVHQDNIQIMRFVRHSGLPAESTLEAGVWEIVVKLEPKRQKEEVKWRDITERKRVEEELREREDQYRSIFESTSDALLIFDFDGMIVEANPAACRMYGYPYEELIGLSGQDIVHPDYHHLFEDFKRQVRASGRFHAQSVDLRKDGSPINVEVHGASFSYRGKPHLLAVSRDITERVQARQILERRVEERTRELSTLLEVSHNVASTLELEPLLGLILDQLKAVVDYSGATVMALEGENLTILAYRGPIPQEEALRLRFPPERARVNHEVIQRREPIIIPDVRGNTSLAHAFGETAGEELETTFSYIRSWMGVPLMVKEQVIGMLTLDHSEPDHYSPRQEELALAFANQAAAAIENARLYERAQELAVVEERSRLARDLHDAVTQTLFSASLIAEVLPRLWERDPDEGWRRLEELRQLTRGALAEMRTLLLELRPSALLDAALDDLLRQLAESITGRARVPVALEMEGKCDLPAEVKVAFYRIAQEALNNVAKHAGASQSSVSLRYIPPDAGGERGGAGAVELRVSDDGRGFDLQNVSPESLGLGIMRERAEAIGAALKIESQVGHGTEVVVVWEDRTGEE